MVASSRTLFGVYDSVYDAVFAMPERLVLAQAEYGKHFVRHVATSTVTDYTLPGSNHLYETILVGEIRPALCGTKFSARGNHFHGNPANVRHLCILCHVSLKLMLHPSLP